MDTRVEAIKREILSRGTDDWVHAGEVAFAAAQAMHGDLRLSGYPEHQQASVEELGRLRKAWLARQEEAALPLGVRAVKELIREGLVQVGDVTDEGFVSWEGAVNELESRIDQVVESAKYPLRPGDLFWLNNTSLGDVRGANVS